jgi:hypothetical protein
MFFLLSPCIVVYAYYDLSVIFLAIVLSLYPSLIHDFFKLKHVVFIGLSIYVLSNVQYNLSMIHFLHFLTFYPSELSNNSNFFYLSIRNNERTL